MAHMLGRRSRNADGLEEDFMKDMAEAIKKERGEPVPLPLQYPANLIFAQNMLAMSVCQVQQLEMHIAMLSLHLRERLLVAQQVTSTVPPSTAATSSSANPTPSIPATLRFFRR